MGKEFNNKVNNSKVKLLYILAHVRRTGLELIHQTCSTTKPWYFLAKTNTVWQAPILSGKHLYHLFLPLFASSQKVYIASLLGLISLSPVMYSFTFMQATLIFFHSKAYQHPPLCLDLTSNQLEWI